MRIRVLFFGQLRDVTGVSEEWIEIQDRSTTTDLFELYTTRFPRLTEYKSTTLMAVNQEFAAAPRNIENGDEIAFLPPVSGGIETYTHRIDAPGGHFFALTRLPIDCASIKQAVLADSDGALICFEGVVRDNTKGPRTRFLEYECYEAMAIKVLAHLGQEIAGKHSIGRIAMIHRLGRMDIGETSVAVVVASPHRKAAFEAALEGINRLKKLVPIWKKEHFEDGEVWVEGEWDDSIRTA